MTSELFTLHSCCYPTALPNRELYQDFGKDLSKMMNKHSSSMFVKSYLVFYNFLQTLT